MITRAEIEAESTVLDDVDIENLVSIIRTSDRYKNDAAYFIDVKTNIEALDGTIKAQQINAALTKLEALGSGVVEINQKQTVGTDGVIYSQKAERDALIDYVLNLMYEGFFNTSPENPDSTNVLKGDYGVGRLILKYEGYL